MKRSSDQEQTITAPSRHSVVVLGDSTIDNKAWLTKKSYWGKPALSVMAHLSDLLNDYTIHDCTNDGFTTHDYLYGTHQDEISGEDTFELLPHKEFKPLEAVADRIRDAQAVILSVGGNNFRKFTQKALSYTSSHERAIFIKKHFNSVMTALHTEHFQIIRRIRVLNPRAKIILMTQYYPSATQNDYKIYPFMAELGKALNIGINPSNPMDVIYQVMKMTYKEILDATEHLDLNIVAADVTSSLDPYDPTNHVMQIEPSNTGGKKIAQMLSYLIRHEVEATALVYRFLPEFFSRPAAIKDDPGVEKTPFSSWKHKHPDEFRKLVCHDHRNALRAIASNAKSTGDSCPGELLEGVDANPKLQQALIALEQTNPHLLTYQNFLKIIADSNLQTVLSAAHGYLNSGRFAWFHTHGSHGKTETHKMVNTIMSLEDPTKQDLLKAMQAWLKTSNINNSSRACYAHRSGFFQAHASSTDSDPRVDNYTTQSTTERKALLSAMMHP